MTRRERRRGRRKRWRGEMTRVRRTLEDDNTAEPGTMATKFHERGCG